MATLVSLNTGALGRLIGEIGDLNCVLDVRLDKQGGIWMLVNLPRVF